MRYDLPIKSKGERIMKTNNAIYRHSSHYCPAYPNEADPGYYRKKLLEILAGLASGAMLTLFLILLMRVS